MFIAKPIKELEKRSSEYYKNLSEDEKLKKIILTIEIKACQIIISKENHYYKRKNLLKHLTDAVEKIENVSLNKLLFKCKIV